MSDSQFSLFFSYFLAVSFCKYLMKPLLRHSDDFCILLSLTTSSTWVAGVLTVQASKIIVCPDYCSVKMIFN